MARSAALVVVVAASVLVGSLVAVGCGSSGDSEFGSSGGSSGQSTSGDNGTGLGGFGGDAAARDASSGSGGDCSAPVDMFIMFDRSGSMGSDCTLGSGTNSKWCRGINAVSGYFKSAGATGQAAALQFFPIRSHSDALCKSGNGYEVAARPGSPPSFQTLPSDAFDSLLNSESPGGGRDLGTPTEAAIRGITRFTSANRRGGRVTIGILVTDGKPSGCSEDLAELSGLLASHHAATQLRTYVIGMEGADFTKLESIAAGGGTPQHPDEVGGIKDACGNGAGPCRHWNVGDGDPAVFGAALAAIQESADGCKPGGGVVNPVN